jgi:hypothetical protein
MIKALLSRLMQLRAQLLDPIIAVFRTQKKPAKGKRKPRQKPGTGALYYLGDLLDNLDDYFRVIAEVKNHDAVAYEYYSRVGCGVTTSDWTKMNRNRKPVLHARWRYGSARPSHAMVHYQYDAKMQADAVEKDEVLPAFCRVSRYRALAGVQFSNQDLYECTVLYRKFKSRRIWRAFPFYVAVDPDGDMSLMRVLKQDYGKPYSKKMNTLKGQVRGHSSRSKLRHHATQSWGLPTWLINFARIHGSTPEIAARTLFVDAARGTDQLGTGFLVRVKNNAGLVGAFSIDMLRTPYFFKDRIKVKNERGNTKHIFHIVRTHNRLGRPVRTHFRGLRKFRWHDYRVQISMPGFHHQLPTHFDVMGYEDGDPMIADQKMMGIKQVGIEMGKHLDEGWKS